MVGPRREQRTEHRTSSRRRGIRGVQEQHHNILQIIILCTRLVFVWTGLEKKPISPPENNNRCVVNFASIILNFLTRQADKHLELCIN